MSPRLGLWGRAVGLVLFLLALGTSGCALFEGAYGYSVKVRTYRACIEDCMGARSGVVIEDDCGCKRPSEVK